jgi:hypothetical protein
MTQDKGLFCFLLERREGRRKEGGKRKGGMKGEREGTKGKQCITIIHMNYLYFLNFPFNFWLMPYNYNFVFFFSYFVNDNSLQATKNFLACIEQHFSNSQETRVL